MGTIPVDSNSHACTSRKVWTWLPSLYVAEALPYVVVNTLTVLIYTVMGISLEDMTFWTGLLYLPWVIKPFWSPFVDIFSSKRKWVLSMQAGMCICFCAAAVFLNTGIFFWSTLVLFYMAAFLSATHDIAADGYYMLQLTEHEQAEYVGWRSTFYRVGSLLGSGGMIWLAGQIEVWLSGHAAEIPASVSVKAWCSVLWVVGILMGCICLYHCFKMPKARNDHDRHETNMREVAVNIARTFVTFFKKRGVVCALLFMLLYRLPEALCIKVVYPFLIGPRSEGGLALSTQAVGIANGVTGVVALLLGGILGGYVISRGGLKKWLWPMALSLTLPCALYCVLAILQPQADIPGLVLINIAIAVEQFGYGFGFTAFMLYLIYFSEGKWKTSHYAFCTGFMALGMMLPGMYAGKVFNLLADYNIFGLPGPQGYTNFFSLVVVCSVFTCIACLLVKIDPNFGKKEA